MINAKYFEDIEKFPSQFSVGFELGSKVEVLGEFSKAIVCGMGGSALYVEMLNNYFESLKVPFKLDVCRGYTLPAYVDSTHLVFIVSHSGNTEETINCLNEAIERNLKVCIISSGGKLLDIAVEGSFPYIQVPQGTQPRLSTGYFIGAILKVLSNHKLTPDLQHDILSVVNEIESDKSLAKEISLKLKYKLPIVYATEINSAIAQIVKIKLNENAKVQSFANYFPELNHNEMVGFTNMVSSPIFLIFKSKFENPRNIKRIEVFERLMKLKNIPVEIICLPGRSIIGEILNTYQLMDYVSYYLAEEYDTDPEPVAMVEEFKKLLSS